MASASSPGTLYLIPNLLGETSVERSMPPYVALAVSKIKRFLVEDEKSARKLIKQLLPESDLRSLNLERLNKHTSSEEIQKLVQPLMLGEDMGVISEAGCPAVADPGADVVGRAHELGARVIPLVGPCSMLLALMASGLNGQRWRFVGYLPIEQHERDSEIKKLDRLAVTTGETQIMMDTPYRNQKLLSDLLGLCQPSTRLCVAQGLTTDLESIKTASISQWRAEHVELRKIPTLFLLGR